MDWDGVIWSVAEFLGLWLARLVGLLLGLVGLAVMLGGIVLAFALKDEFRPAFIVFGAVAVVGFVLGGACMSASDQIIEGLRRKR